MTKYFQSNINSLLQGRNHLAYQILNVVRLAISLQVNFISRIIHVISICNDLLWFFRNLHHILILKSYNNCNELKYYACWSIQSYSSYFILYNYFSLFNFVIFYEYLSWYASFHINFHFFLELSVIFWWYLNILGGPMSCKRTIHFIFYFS